MQKETIVCIIGFFSSRGHQKYGELKCNTIGVKIKHFEHNNICEICVRRKMSPLAFSKIYQNEIFVEVTKNKIKLRLHIHLNKSE